MPASRAAQALPTHPPTSTPLPPVSRLARHHCLAIARHDTKHVLVSQKQLNQNTHPLDALPGLGGDEHDVGPLNGAQLHHTKRGDHQS